MLRTEYYFGAHSKNKVYLEGNTMKFSRILAAAASLTMIAAVAVPVSANNIAPTNEKATNGKENWEAVYTWEDYVDGTTLPDGDLTVTVTFDWTEKGINQGFTSFKPMFANGSVAIYNAERAAGKTYITGVPVQTIDVLEEEKDADGNTKSSTGHVDKDGNTAYFGMSFDDADDAATAVDDNDGWIQFWYDEENPVTTCTFTLTADCIADIKDTSSYWGDGKDAEDGSKWDGFNIQTGNNGIVIKSIEYSADVKLHSELGDGDSNPGGESSSAPSTDSSSKKADDSSKSGGNTTGGTTKTTGGTAAATGTTDATDTQAATGATAGLVFAGIALAGAAVVVTKRK